MRGSSFARFVSLSPFVPKEIVQHSFCVPKREADVKSAIFAFFSTWLRVTLGCI